MAIINGLNIETTHIKDIKVGDVVLFHGVEKNRHGERYQRGFIHGSVSLR